MKLNKDHYLSLFYIGLGVLILFFTSRITSLFTVATNDTGPKFFPTLCGIGKFLTSAKSNPKTFLPNKRDYIRLAGLWALLVVYVLSVKYLGYIFSSLVLMFVMTTLLADTKKLNVWHRILFAILMVALTYVLFSYVIKIPLPQGKWIKTLLKAIG